MINVSESSMLGAVGEKAVTADLLSKGFTVFDPAYEGGNTDLIALRGDQLYRIQVKYRSLSSGDKAIKLPRSLYQKCSIREWHKDVDVIAIYVVNYNEIFYVATDQLPKESKSASFSTKRKQGFYLYDYREFPLDSGNTVIERKLEL